MSDTLDIRTLLKQSRPRIYLLWAALTVVGFTATHFYQNTKINLIWIVLVLPAFAYMYRLMPLRVRQMRDIYLSWLLPISLGIAASILTAQFGLFPSLLGYLGVLWLFLLSVGYISNGVADPPGKWYFVAATVNFLAGVLCYYSDDFLRYQYLVAAVVSGWSMLSLWLFRGDA